MKTGDSVVVRLAVAGIIAVLGIVGSVLMQKWMDRQQQKKKARR